MGEISAIRAVAISISLIASILNILVLILVYRKSRPSTSTFLWASFITFIAISSIGEAGIRSTDDFKTASIPFALILFAGAFIPPLWLHFTLEFPTRHRWLMSLRNRVIFMLIFYVPNIILLIRALLNTPTADGEEVATVYGFLFTRDSMVQAVASDVYKSHYLFLITTIFIGILVIYSKLKKANEQKKATQLRLVFIGVAIIFIPSVFLDLFLFWTFGIFIESYSISLTTMALIITYAIIKENFLVISPRLENLNFGSGQGPKVEPGYCYLFPKSKRNDGKDAFLKALSQKREGIFLTGFDPKKVHSEFNLKRTPIVTIGRPTDYELNIDSRNLDGLVGTMAAFMGVTVSPILAIDIDTQNMDSQGQKQSRKYRNGQRYMLEDWFKGDKLVELSNEADRLLSNGITILIFTYDDNGRIIRTKKPLQHSTVTNLNLIENLLTLALGSIEGHRSDPKSLLTELAVADPFFNAIDYDGSKAECPIRHIYNLTRPKTIEKVRTMLFVLSRIKTKGMKEAFKKVVNYLDALGYSKNDFDMLEGSIHFLVTDEHRKGFHLTKELVASGFDGLCLSTRPSEKIEQKYGLSDVEFIWITTSRTKEKKTVPPSLEYIKRDIKKFMVGHDDGVILLDGIELLISRLGFENVQRFLHIIKDEIALTQARMIIPTSPKAIGEQRLALLKREVEV